MATRVAQQQQQQQRLGVARPSLAFGGLRHLSARLTQLRARVRACPASVATSTTTRPIAVPTSADWPGPSARETSAEATRAPAAAAQRQRQRRRAALVAQAWSWPGAPSSPTSSEPPADLPRDVLDLSLVLLVHENLRRRLGRGILPTTEAAGGSGDGAASSSSPPPVDVLTALGAAEALPAALFLFSDAEDGGGGVGGGELAYINAAGRELLRAVAGGDPLSPPAPPDTLLQALPRITEDTPCAELRDARWSVSGDSLFLFPRALACPVAAPSGEPVGRALLAAAWAFSEGEGDQMVGRPGWPRIASKDIPSATAVSAASEAVRTQADRVRALKQEAAARAAGNGADADDPNRSRGSPANRDPAVLEAVAELGKLKAELAEAEAMRAAFFGGGEDGEGEAAAVGGTLMADLLRRARG